eukprot:c8662_g1_i1 orf=2-154(-)
MPKGGLSTKALHRSKKFKASFVQVEVGRKPANRHDRSGNAKRLPFTMAINC